jgi:RsiW-degrading membrane proteinase PrsW (M82 family)
MNLLESLPTVIGTAAVAPALLILWLVVAADERPGSPVKVWTAFVLGAASISLLGVLRAPFAALLAAPENPWVAQVVHSVFGVALPEETVKILVIAAVSARRRAFADPMDTVVYGAAAGLGFAAYENLAYLVQHAEMWQSREPAPRLARTVITATGPASQAGFWFCSDRWRCMRALISRC